MHTVYHMFNQCLIVLGFKDAHFFKLQYVSRGELPTSKGVILRIWFVVLEEYHIMHSENLCAIVTDIFSNFTCLHVPCVLH